MNTNAMPSTKIIVLNASKTCSKEPCYKVSEKNVEYVDEVEKTMHGYSLT